MTDMKVRLAHLQVRHTVAFAPMATGFVFQGGRLLELIIERLTPTYTIGSHDVAIRSGATLGDWELRLSMFNGLAKTEITAERMLSTYTRLVGSSDLPIVLEVQAALLSAMSTHSPTLKYSAESIGGAICYEVVDGTAAREEYFSRVAFPGRCASHFDVGLKARLRHQSEALIGNFDLSPVWSDAGQALLSFDLDTSQVASQEFSARAKLAVELVSSAVASFELQLEAPK